MLRRYILFLLLGFLLGLWSVRWKLANLAAENQKLRDAEAEIVASDANLKAESERLMASSAQLERACKAAFSGDR